MKATSIAFERRYADDSGIEYAVRLKPGEIQFEAVDTVSFPIKEIDWLLNTLQRIKQELPAANNQGSGDADA